VPGLGAELADGDNDLGECARVAVGPVVAQLRAIRCGQGDLVVAGRGGQRAGGRAGGQVAVAGQHGP